MHWGMHSDNPLNCIYQSFNPVCVSMETNPFRHDPGHPVVGVPAWVESLDKITSTGPFQPQLFCNSVWFDGSSNCLILELYWIILFACISHLFLSALILWVIK